MKSLSLYIDKWFIAVAINHDGNVLPLSLPNGEDRIWLYFHEDIANGRIEYGRAFENSYRDTLPHYFGDIFNLIEEGGYYFTRYERRREDMREIFKVSGIFSHLHQAVEEDGSIDTYISFSSDIPDVARLRFIEELEASNFKVIESVARISHLALEECKKRKIFTSLGVYLVLAATNDNFHYSLYENAGDIFLRKNEGKLLGLGWDVRRRALVETIVENINKNNKLLKTREEFESECVRQNRFASEWLDKINGSKSYIPVAFDNITFAVAPNNPMSVMILPKELDNRTSALVEEVVRKTADFVKENQLQPHEIKGIVFIGNAFTNHTFTRAINNKFIVDEDKIVIYREEELPKIVSVYSQIDCGQFKGETTRFLDNAKIKETLKKQAKEEEERKKKAEEAARCQQEIVDSQRNAEKVYNEAVDNIKRYESDHNYEEMLEWARIALSKRPDDEFAKEKETLAIQLKAEQTAANKQFKDILLSAKTAISEKRWTDAVSQCDMALKLRSDSEEISQLKKEAQRQEKIEKDVQGYLNRADMFFAQKLYAEALEEVNKIIALDSFNQKAKELKTKISEIHAQREKRVTDLVSKLNEAELTSDYVSAIEICDSLIEEDANQCSQWKQKKESLLTLKIKHEESLEQKNKLKEEILQRYKKKEWSMLITLCQQYLQNDDDAEVTRIQSESKSSIELQLAQTKFDDAVESEDWSRVIRLYNDNQILRDVPGNNSIIKFARNQLRIQRTQRKPHSIPTSKIELSEDPGKTPYPRPRSRRVMPQTLLEDSSAEIIRGTRKPKFPKPQKSQKVELKNENSNIVSNKTTTKRGKYPKVSRN